MPGATTRVRAFGPALLTNASATKITVAAGTTMEIRQIHISNGSTSAATLTISIGADAAGTRIADALPIPANSVLDLWGPYYLLAAEILAAFSGTTGVLTMTCDGSTTVTG